MQRDMNAGGIVVNKHTVLSCRGLGDSRDFRGRLGRRCRYENLIATNSSGLRMLSSGVHYGYFPLECRLRSGPGKEEREAA